MMTLTRISKSSKEAKGMGYELVKQTEDGEKLHEERIHTQPQRLVSTWTLLLLGLTNLGLGAAWSLLFALVTPYFEKALSSGQVISHGVWFLGPISGLVVAPLVGYLSDRCTSRYGRRRPYILSGMITTAIGFAIFPNSRNVASLFLPTGSEQHTTAALCIAITAFAIIVFSLNWGQFPARALMGDLVPGVQQHSLQAALVLMISLAGLAMSAMIHSFEEPVSHAHFFFLVTAVVFVASKTLLLVIGEEVPIELSTDDDGDDAVVIRADGDDAAVIRAYGEGSDVGASCDDGSTPGWVAYIKQMPRWMWHLGLTTSLGWFMMFCIRPNASSWIARSVLGGDPQAEAGTEAAALYEKGVNIYGRASIKRTIIQIICAILYPRLMHAGLLPSYFVGISHIICASVLFKFGRTKDGKIAEWVVVSLAFPMVSHFTAQNSVIVAMSPPHQRGINLGVINIFAVLPQLIDTTYTGVLSNAFGESAVMLTGAAWGIAAAIAAFTFKW